MVEIHMFKYYCLFFILFSNLLNYVSTYRDPSDSPSYEIHSLAEEDVCHPLHKSNKLKTSLTLDRAVIIRPSNVFDRWQNRPVDLVCKFKLKTTRPLRLMAVVQNLSFRPNKRKKGCLDYVEFKRKNQSHTQTFCGQWGKQREDTTSYSSSETTVDIDTQPFEKSDSDGEIETTIFVSKTSLEANEPPLDITIVYTPYEDCVDRYHERIGDLTLTSRQWNHSIADEYICDGYQNCIPALCKDEFNCPEVYNSGTGAKVTVAAVTTIFLTFLIFLMGIWICRRHKKLCWSSDCAGPQPEDTRFSRANRETGVVSDQPVPSAPMLQVSVVSSAVDKDLPPSYDSLFPEHANPSAT